ncbi:MAG: hypothetical protein H0U16_11965 [Actinobacteria bacterium]|nr:hypothetical protein [Actinomycetota bacterium]
MTTPELRPLSVGEIVDVAVKLYRRHALTLFKVVAVVVIPVAILNILITLSTAPDPGAVTDLATTPSGTLPDLGPLYGFLAGTLVSAFISFLAATLATGACFKAITDAYLGHEPDSNDSLSFAGRRLGSLVWVSFLGSLIVGLGFLLLIVPGIYLGVAFSVAVPVLLMESHRGKSALGRSRDLVRGRWWPVLGTIVLGFILQAIVAAIVQGILQGILLTGAGESLVTTTIVVGFSNVVASILTTPLQAALITVLYLDLRVRKEGFDLALLAEDMGRSDGPGPVSPHTYGPTAPPPPQGPPGR